MNEDFSRVLRTQMDYYSNAKNSDKITKVKGEIDDLKSTMVENIERVLNRGERIELLVDKTETLGQQAVDFKKQSTALKRSMWIKNMKITVLLVCVIILALYFLISIFCGLTFKKCKKSSPPPPPPPPQPSPSPASSIQMDPPRVKLEVIEIEKIESTVRKNDHE